MIVGSSGASASAWRNSPTERSTGSRHCRRNSARALRYRSIARGSLGAGRTSPAASTVSASAMAAAASSLTTSRSVAGRSKRLAQSWKPSATLMSRAAIRIVWPVRRTDPCTTTCTPSSRPTSRESTALVNATTAPCGRSRSPRAMLSVSIRSSVSPSATYWSSGGPAFLNGKTATALSPTGVGSTGSAGRQLGTGVSDVAPLEVEISFESVSATSRALSGRSPGSRAMQPSTSAAISSGRSGRRVRGSGGGLVRRAVAMRNDESACQGSSSVSISNSVTPRAYRSARPSTFRSPSTCSGAMYAGVPTAPPTVLPSEGSSMWVRAIPKSVTTTRPLLSSITLSGFRSRCTTPASCAAERAAHVAWAMESARATDSAPARASNIESGSPSTYSIVRNFSPSCSPMSKVRATLGCVTRLASFTSRLKRSSTPGTAMSSPFNILSATISSSSRSRTRYTLPIPPSPTSPSTS